MTDHSGDYGTHGAEAHLCEPCAEGFHGDCLGYPKAAMGSCLCSCPDATQGRRNSLHVPEAPVALAVPLYPLSWRRRIRRRLDGLRRWVRFRRIVWSGRWDLWRHRG